MQGTEPMMMGSPSSPSSPGAHGQPFLPSFLMGQVSPVGSPQTSQRLWSGQSTLSPPVQPNSANKSFSSNVCSASTSVFAQTPRQDRPRGKDKAGAPPVSGLLDHITSPKPTPDNKQVHFNQSVGPGMTSTSFIGTPHHQGHDTTKDASFFSPLGQSTRVSPSPAQIDPFYTQGDSIRYDEDLDNTWVTIFGFPPAASAFILQQFSQYGNIVKHVMATEGNWIHVKYQSTLQAKKALSKNSKVFGGSMMVGVTQCINKNVINGDKENQSMTFGTPGGMNQSCNAADMARSPIRPLTAAYRAASSEYDVLNQSLTPRKNKTMITKAMDYMFGW